MEHSSYKIRNLCEIAIFVKELTHNFIRVNLRFIVDNKSCSYHVYCVLISNLIGSFCTITCRVVALILQFHVACETEYL